MQTLLQQEGRVVRAAIYERKCVNSWILLADIESALMYLYKYFWLTQ